MYMQCKLQPACWYLHGCLAGTACRIMRRGRASEEQPAASNAMLR